MVLMSVEVEKPKESLRKLRIGENRHTNFGSRGRMELCERERWSSKIRQGRYWSRTSDLIMIKSIGSFAISSIVKNTDAELKKLKGEKLGFFEVKSIHLRHSSRSHQFEFPLCSLE